MDTIIETEKPSPNPTPDPLFGGGEPLAEVIDVDSLTRMMQDGNVTVFNFPLVEKLHRRPYHLLRLRGSFNLARLLRDHRSQLFRSESCRNATGETHIERLMFDLGENVFVLYSVLELSVYAPTSRAAATVAAQMKKYRRLEREKPGFRLVSLNCGQPSAQLVTVEQPAPVSEQELALHYGEDFPGWERQWLDRLGQRRSGVSVLHGPPGCGKTSYLRGLMSRLMGRFEFYYLPVSTFDVLTDPRFVTFWLEQTGDQRRKQKIAIMEDAENLLLPRDAGSQTDVSNLLNIGDGFLGEHLKLHVIATTNSPVRQLDPALLRPGRLMGTREFRRLTRREAQRLAEVKGLALADQNDYSLAELYCGAVSTTALNADRQVGFARCEA